MPLEHLVSAVLRLYHSHWLMSIKVWQCSQEVSGTTNCVTFTLSPSKGITNIVLGKHSGHCMSHPLVVCCDSSTQAQQNAVQQCLQCCFYQAASLDSRHVAVPRLVVNSAIPAGGRSEWCRSRLDAGCTALLRAHTDRQPLEGASSSHQICPAGTHSFLYPLVIGCTSVKMPVTALSSTVHLQAITYALCVCRH